MRKQISVEELGNICDLTLRLVELRQKECKHLCVENMAPEIFRALLNEYSAIINRDD